MSSSAIRAGRAFVELFADSSKLTRGLKSAEGQVREFGAKVKSVGMSITLAAVAMAAPFAISAKTFADFSDKMSQVRAITNASVQDFDRLNDKAKELGATTSFTARQVAEGMTFLGMAGFNTEQILAGIPAVLNLARAGAIDLGMAADIASDVGSAFGLAADDIAHIADVMAVTATSANTNIAMMGETLKYAAPLAKAAGQSLEDTATAIGIMGNSGIKASMAGTDLAMIMKLIAGDAKEAMEAIGVFSVDAEGNIRSVLDVMKDLGKATATMTEADRLQFFAKNFDRAAKSAIILADAGDSMDTLRAKIGNAEGAAERMAKTMDDNMGGSFRALMSAVEGVQIAIGTALEPTIRSVAAIITELTGDLQTWISRHKTLISAIASGIAVIGAVGVALATIGTVAQASAFMIGGLVQSFALLKAASLFLVANPIVAAIVAITLALTACAIAMGEVNAADVSDTFQKAVAAGDQQRKSAQMLMQRLEQLAEKQQLNKEEAEEAEYIIRQLGHTYGDLGVSVDAATGKIVGLTGAQQRLNDMMREAKLREINAAMMETANNMKELEREAGEATGWWANTWFGGGGADRVAAIGDQIAVEQAKYNALLAQRNAVRGGEEGAVTGEKPATPLDKTEANLARQAAEMAKAREEGMTAEEKWAAIEEQMAAKRRTHLEQEIKDIQDLAEERRKLNDLRIAGEKARAGGARQEVLDQLEADRARIDEEEMQGMSDAVFEDGQKAIDEENAKRKRAAEEAAQRDQERADSEAQTLDEIARLEIEVDPDLTPMEKELKLLELEMQRELAEAAELGLDPEQIKKKYDLQKQLIDQGDGVFKAADEATAGTTTGSFSALAAQRSFAGGSAQDRTAKATEATAVTAAKILEQQKAQVLRFR